MKRRAALLMLLLLVAAGSASAARENLQFRMTAFDRFMAYTMGPTGIPVKIPVPMEYASQELASAALTTFWIREDDMADVRQDGALPERHGWMSGKIAADVHYEVAQDLFTGLEDPRSSESLRAQMTELTVERLDHPKYPAVLLSGKQKSSGNRVYTLYLALDIGNNVGYVTLQPAGNDRNVGETLWRALRKGLLEIGHRPRR